MTAIFDLWAGALALYVLDLRAAYRTEYDRYNVRRDFEGSCQQLRRLIEPPGFELEIVKKAIRLQLVKAGVINLQQCRDADGD